MSLNLTPLTVMFPFTVWRDRIYWADCVCSGQRVHGGLPSLLQPVPVGGSEFCGTFDDQGPGSHEELVKLTDLVLKRSNTTIIFFLMSSLDHL